MGGLCCPGRCPRVLGVVFGCGLGVVWVWFGCGFGCGLGVVFGCVFGCGVWVWCLGVGLGVVGVWIGVVWGVFWVCFGCVLGAVWVWFGRGLGAFGWCGCGVRVWIGVDWVWFGCGLGGVWVWFGCGLGVDWARFGRGLGAVCQKDPNRFDRERLFSAVVRGSPEALDGLLEYLRRNSKFLTNSEYTDAKTGKTCLMKALLNLKNGKNDTIPVLLEIDQKMQNPRPLVNVSCSDCFYRGQTALHIAIEKRSLDLVKLLVENGADVHARAHGEFFRKKKEGVYFYFGELPLSLAACTNQLDVVDYLLTNPHQKARLQEQDTQGNTVLHALVMIADDTEDNTNFVSTTYVELLKAGVKLDPACKLEEIVNYDGLNPLQLAAKTGKVEIFRHIIQREIKDPVYRHLSRKFTEWTYGPIHVSLYDLSSLDSFEENSVLEILAYSSDTPNRYKMVVLEPLNKLLQQKWETFASKRFYFSFASYLSFMIIFTAIAYYQPLRVKVGPVLKSLKGWMSPCHCLLSLSSFIQAFSLLLSAVLYGASSENYVAVMVFSLLLGWVNTLYYTRGFQRTGIYSVMIQKTIMRDLLRFLLVYMIFLFGFAAALVTLMGDAPSVSHNKSLAQPESPGSHAMYGGLLSVSLELFKITIGMGDLDFQEHARFRYFVMLLLLLFVILTYILLLNMLIALMSETVTDISAYSKSVWKLQRAIAILEIEKAWLWRQGGKRRSGCFMSVGLNKKDERWCFRVEEIKWTDWAKDVGVLKEDPGNTSDSEINPEGKLNHQERSAEPFQLPAQQLLLPGCCVFGNRISGRSA
uniref:Transient receptor potential cation channel subfamily V member 2 n=1 Tax=Malurus cyaneus samueli TaxID=2593467 RepID=A0A8C5X012_9PASS